MKYTSDAAVCIANIIQFTNKKIQCDIDELNEL